MKAISLWQPWATAIAIGAKRIETRGWCTGYRGCLAIHAAKRLNQNELLFRTCCGHWDAALQSVPGFKDPDFGNKRFLWDIIPFGAIVAIGKLEDCRPAGDFTGEELDTKRFPDGKPGYRSWTERSMGDFSLGRWGWVLRNIRPLATPIPCIGRQSLFNLTPQIEDAILEQGMRLCRQCGAPTKTELVCDACYRQYTPTMLDEIGDDE